jgi:ribosome biogenesis protein UTP30
MCHHLIFPSCRSVRIGTLTHLSPSQMTDNIVESLPKIVAKHVKGGWENVQSIDIKTGSSAALPVWNSKLDERWIGMPEPAVDGESGSESEDDEVENKKTNGDKLPAKKSKTIDSSVEKKVRSSISKESSAPKVKKTKRIA